MMPSSPTQSAYIANGGSGTIVQVVGDGNCIVPTHAHLRLTRYTALRTVRRELDWLSPYTRSTPLIGRDDELQALQSFLHDPRKVLIRVLIGGAGRGKTRLAVELCELASAAGWEAGLVSHAELARFFALQNLSSWGWHKPTLIVIDYAAQQAQGIAGWVDELADRAGVDAPPLRVLLLERSASLKFGWFAQVFNRGGYADSGRQALLDPLKPLELEPLRKEHHRLALVECLRRRIVPACGLLTARDRIKLSRQLGSEQWAGDPLYVMMATLTSTHLDDALAFTFERNELARGLAHREAARIRELARPRHMDEQFTVHLAACATLMQGMSLQRFVAFAETEKGAMARSAGGDAAMLAQVLGEALPRADGIAPIVPDLIGEAFVLDTLSDSDAGSAAVVRCFMCQGIAVAQFLIRCSQDFSPQRPEPLAWLESIERAIQDDEGALISLYESLRTRNITLQPMALRVAERLLEICAGKNDVSAEECALALSRVAVASIGIGNPTTTVAAARDVVEAYRRLAHTEPHRFAPDLAAALSNYSTALEDVCERHRALEAASEATTLYRQLTDREPRLYRIGLASALVNYSNILHLLCQDSLATQAAKEAVELWRDQLTHGSDVHRPLLAAALSVYGNALTAIGNLEQGLYATEEAVDLYRDSAARTEDVYRRNLSSALSNLSATYIELDELEAAARVTEEALAQYEEIPPQHADLFLPLLATLHSRLAHAMWGLGERDTALRLAESTVASSRVLVSEDPAMYWPDLAVALNNQAYMLAAIGEKERAQNAALEALGVYEALGIHGSMSPEWLGIVRRQYAAVVGGSAVLFEDIGRRDLAVKYAREAAPLMAAIVAERPECRSSIEREFAAAYARVCTLVKGEDVHSGETAP